MEIKYIETRPNHVGLAQRGGLLIYRQQGESFEAFKKRIEQDVNSTRDRTNG